MREGRKTSNPGDNSAQRRKDARVRAGRESKRSAGTRAGTSHAQMRLARAKQVVTVEGDAVLALVNRLDQGFLKAVDMILACDGQTIVTGMGKSGLVGQKISATLASTGTPSLFLHAAEAVHGDMGRIKRGDVVLALSFSGESDEILRLIQPVRAFGASLIALTGKRECTLAKQADAVIAIGPVSEACPMGLVPTASTTAMMVVGDALAMCLFEERDLDQEDYAQFHPGGQLGRKLMRVQEVMRRDESNPVVQDTATLREVIRVMTETKGRPGATSIVDGRGRLVGFFTDGDLRRLLEAPTFTLDVLARNVMHRDPKAVRTEQLAVEVACILQDRKIDQVPVVDDKHRPVGFIDIQDILSLRVV
ncbi:MAG: hypothetical protein A2289_12790 [Deltaproteobacteria bacterium RIFOXYA12_FULL_58_15]|nr:MAG: hypothetical protein A2289_12790 [Deltaproteobacteria bacterium RIFOXYA12_FULL_58_15]OGR14214.1 MAG: hypothetical protein A2341_13375 [Deltaproteobacteria bacterium RIFOXYB12_FULL_58_9]